MNLHKVAELAVNVCEFVKIKHTRFTLGDTDSCAWIKEGTEKGPGKKVTQCKQENPIENTAAENFIKIKKRRENGGEHEARRKFLLMKISRLTEKTLLIEFKGNDFPEWAFY